MRADMQSTKYVHLLDRFQLSNYVALDSLHTRGNTMAKRRKGGVNVSAAIRDYLEANPDVGPTEAAEAISK